ncbi:MAG: hypothetical protein H6923_09005 [Alphaproteobacteria bacterium]|nr:hypothetical protein [Alphaproteobacteria bacterium]
MRFGAGLLAASGALLWSSLAFAQASPPAAPDAAIPAPPPSVMTPPAEPAADPAPMPVAETPAPTAPAPEAPVEASAPPAYDPMAAQQLGPLVVTPRDPNFTVTTANDQANLDLRLRFLVQNASSADVKVMFLGKTITAVDDTGIDLMPHDNVSHYSAFETQFVATGVPVCGAVPPNFQDCFDNAAGFLTLAPGQRVELTVTRTPRWTIKQPDKNRSFTSSYRPTSLSTSGAFAIKDLGGQIDIRTFSIVDLPVTVK